MPTITSNEPGNLLSRLARHPIPAGESFWIFIISLGFMISYYPLLVTGKLMATQDSIGWYGLFQYYVESIYAGDWPLWNPYTHCGEPFYFNYLQVPLLEPVTLLIILAGRMFKADIMSLYHWMLIIQFMIMNIGTYVCLRQFMDHRQTRILLYFIISFSSVPLICLRLLGIWQVFHWFPWILYFLLNIIRGGRRLIDWIALAAMTGIALHNYSVIYVMVALTIFLLPSLATHPVDLIKTVCRFIVGHRCRIALGLATIICLSSPLWTSVLFDMHKLFPILRELDNISKAITVSQENIPAIEQYWQSATDIRDFLGLVTPLFPRAYFFEWFNTGLDTSRLTETFMYIGILPLALSLCGLRFARRRLAVNFLIFTVAMAFLMLGSRFVVYRLLFSVFPGMRYLRHPMQFFPFFMFGLYYFCGRGLDLLIEHRRRRPLSVSTNKFFNGRLLAWFCVIAGLFHVLNISRIASAIDAWLLLYGCLVTFLAVLLLNRSRLTGRYLMPIIIVFTAMDLSFYNYINRPLMLLPRILNFSTRPQPMRFSEHREYNFPFHPLSVRRGRELSNITTKPIRYMSLLLRTHSFDIEYRSYTAAFFQIKEFHDLTSLPVPALRMMGGIDSPMVRLVTSYRTGDDREFRDWAQTRAAIDTGNNEVFISRHGPDVNLPAPAAAPTETFAYRVTRYASSEIELDVTAPQTGFLYLSDGYDDGWRAFINQRRTELFRANHYFKAVIVPPGRHRVLFQFRPVHHLISLWAYFLTLTVVAGYSLLVLPGVAVSAWYKQRTLTRGRASG